MNITKTDILEGSLISSIAHAIMTNVYPDLAYEQSWDGKNFSIQNSSGLRGTITFEFDYCIGAIRNDNTNIVVNNSSINEYMKCFPANIFHKAYEETLQYLLLERNGNIAPYVTSMFWADDFHIYFDKSCIDNLKEDFILLKNIIQPKEIAIAEWKAYYDMSSNAIELLTNLYEIKVLDFDSEIVLDEKQKQLIPGDFINYECVESLKELNILLR